MRDRVNKADGGGRDVEQIFINGLAPKKRKHGLRNIIFVEKCNKASCMSI